MSEDTKTFWLEDFEGTAKGGYFVRNPLFQFFEKLKAAGEKPVAIKVDESWNLEVLVEEK
jgi:hypothetical protein